MCYTHLCLLKKKSAEVQVPRMMGEDSERKAYLTFFGRKINGEEVEHNVPDS